MRSEKGQTLLELVVAVGVSVIVIGALVFAIISSLRNASFSKNQAQATKLAQEGLERVRMGRDRDKGISVSIGSNTITSWKGNGSDCSTNTFSIWCNQINGNCGNTNPSPPTAPTYCYFNVASTGELTAILVSTAVPIGADNSSPSFKRAIIVSDDQFYQDRKTVTSVVTWTDFSGPHESRLTTLLRKL